MLYTKKKKTPNTLSHFFGTKNFIKTSLGFDDDDLVRYASGNINKLLL